MDEALKITFGRGNQPGINYHSNVSQFNKLLLKNILKSKPTEFL